MKFQVAISRRADAEIRATAEWWSQNRSASQASRWLRGTHRAIMSLAKSPDRHPLAMENDVVSRELREAHFGLSKRPTHRIVFTILDDKVMVLSVRHAAQDALRDDDILIE